MLLPLTTQATAKAGLVAMESSQIETMVSVVPRAHPAGYRAAEVTDIVQQGQRKCYP